MIVKTVFACVLFILLSLSIHAAEGGFATEGSCTSLCDTKDYIAAAACFEQSRSKQDAYLATSHCALKNYDDADAEAWAIKSARERERWIQFIRQIPQVRAKIRTGGLGESYMAAHLASGETRYKEESLDYAKTSGQCQGSSNPDACAGQYFNNTMRVLRQRNAITGRNTNPNLNKLALQGTIRDDMFGHVFKNVKVNFKCAGRDYITYTDANGKYSIPVGLSTPPCDEGRLYFKMQYHEPNDRTKIFFRLMFSNRPVWVMKKFPINDLSDLRQDIVLKNETANDPAIFSFPQRKGSMRHFSIMYHHMTEVLEYFKDHLKVDVGYKLPVDVHSWVRNSGTYYTPTTATIVIDRDDSRYTSGSKPMNREYHEFSHHVMYALYSKWPQGGENFGIGMQNHDGFNNPSTSDSFVEGFAEFMAMVISEHYKYPNPHIYADFGSWERNIKPWYYGGMGEEMAVAGILWDIHDAKNDDQVDLQFNQIWNIIKVYQNDFGDVWEEFRDKFPAFTDEMTRIWESHGFWSDTTPGNAAFDRSEAFRDLDKDGVRDANEPFTDYAQEPGLGYPWFIRQENEKVGFATNYERPARRSAARIPGHHIKTTDTWPTYTVKVNYKDGDTVEYQSNNINGLIYVQVPERDEQASIEVRADSPRSTVFRYESSAFHDNLDKIHSDGYFAQHSFNAPSFTDDTEPENQPDASTLDKETRIPYWDTVDRQATKEDYEYVAPIEYALPLENEVEEWIKNPKEESAGARPTSIKIPGKEIDPVLAILVGIIVLIILSIVLKRKKKKSKN